MWKFTLFFFTLTLAYVLGYSPSYNEIKQKADEDAENITNTRRYLHQHPERYFKEFETSAYIKQFLKENNISFTDGWAKPTPDSGGTGVVAQIGTGHPPCISLRADMDALPLDEQVDIPFKSTHPNMMHACGHDAHTAMLLGAAKIVKSYEDQIEGTIRFVFQPAEEGGGGGHYMVEEGLLSQYPPVQYAFGSHISGNPTGVIGAKAGSVNAATDDFEIKVYGKGGHAARPHKLIDPLPAAMSIIRSIYDMYARELYFEPKTAGVYSVTYLQSGEGATNVVPNMAVIGGTMRALYTDTLHKMRDRLYESAKEIAHTYRCTVDIQRTMNMEYPASINDNDLHDWFFEVSKDFQEGGAVTNEPIMAGEDFSFTSQVVPSVFWSIGIGSGHEIEGHPPTDMPPHNPSFAIDERALPKGSAVYAFVGMKAIDKINMENTQ